MSEINLSEHPGVLATAIYYVKLVKTDKTENMDSQIP